MRYAFPTFYGMYYKVKVVRAVSRRGARKAMGKVLKGSDYITSIR